MDFQSPSHGVGFSSVSPRAPSYSSPHRQNQSSGDHNHGHGDAIGAQHYHHPRNARAQQGEPDDQRHVPFFRGGGSDYELDARLPPPPPSRFLRHPGASIPFAADAADAAAAAVMSGVHEDRGGVQDAEQLVRRVEASARAVSRENEDVVKVPLVKIASVEM